MHKKVVWILVTLLMLTCGMWSAEGRGSHFGLDYVFPLDKQYQKLPLAQLYKQAGLRWVNFADVRWKFLEPSPPVGKNHRYQWQNLDKAVRHWQVHGFFIVMTLRTGKAWFSGPSTISIKKASPVIKLMVAQSDRMPKPEHMDSFRRFITEIVERYDGDGKRDMPGLKNPVLHYQIGNEYGNPAFWTSSVDDYFKLLKTASQSARAACRNIKIIPSGLRTNDAFHNDPKAQRLDQTMAKYEARMKDPFYVENWKRGRQLDEGALSLKGVIDVVDAGGNGSWHTTSEGYYTYVMRILRAAGNGHIPVWDMEARNEPLLTPISTTHIYMNLGIPFGKHLVNVLKKPRHHQYKRAKAWYLAEQARITAKVFVSKFAAGNRKVFMGMPMDWDKGIGSLSWPNPFMGFCSASAEPWPAYWTLKFLVSKLDGFTKASRLPAAPGISLFRFDLGAGRGPVWAAWLEDKRPRGLNAPLPARKVKLKGIVATRAMAIPTQSQTASAVSMTRGPGNVTLRLSVTPVFFFKY